MVGLLLAPGFEEKWGILIERLFFNFTEPPDYAFHSTVRVNTNTLISRQGIMC
jgi:hypothetical protein